VVAWRLENCQPFNKHRKLPNHKCGN
jgi:hypothetical protein